MSDRFPIGVAITYRSPSRLFVLFAIAIVILSLLSCTPILTSSRPSTTTITKNEVEGDTKEQERINQTLALVKQLIKVSDYRGAERKVSSLFRDTYTANDISDSQRLAVLEIYARLVQRHDLERAIDLVSRFDYSDDRLVSRVNLLLRELSAYASDFTRAFGILQDLSDQSYLNEEEANSQIWKMLLQEGGFHAIDWAQVENPNLRAWADLASRIRSEISASNRRVAVQEWQKQYPNHSANEYPPINLDPMFSGTLSSDHPNKIAVILPTQGQLANAAMAIREGFLFAYMRDVNSSTSSSDLMVKFYDSNSADPRDLVQQAFDEGAELIVGFIDKSRANEIVRQGPYQGPVLLLNRVPEGSDNQSSNILQFALSIDDEVDAIIAKLNSQGARRIIVMAGDHAWAIRSRNRFLVQYENEHRVVLAQQVFLEPTLIIDDVGQALQISKSQSRRTELERRTRAEFEFVPRRRLDIDAIVAFVDHAEFQSMLAALNYHYAGDVPLFVTETAVRSGSTSEFLSPVLFTASPWVIEDTPLEMSVHEVLSPAIGSEALYAFGIDTYRMVTNWNHFNEMKWIFGSSGTLQIRDDGTISRTPLWGQLKDQRYQVSRYDVNLDEKRSYLNLPRISQ